MPKQETISVAEYRKMVSKRVSLRSGPKQNTSGRNNLHKIGIALMQQGHDVAMEYAFHPTRRWRFDLAIPKLKIAVEYEGIFSSKSRHTSVKGYTEDCEKYNEAQILGWTVIRVTAKNMSGLYSRLQRLIQRKS